MQEFFELVAFIEYVGPLPSSNSTRTRAHYIAYRYVVHRWYQNDDHRCHSANVDGDYKINMAFYKRISTATHDDFTIEDKGILNWKKSVVIRPVYKSPPCPRGRGRGCGHGRGGKVITGDSLPKSTEKEKKADENDDATESPLQDLTEEDMYIFGYLSSEHDEDGKESYCIVSLIFLNS